MDAKSIMENIKEVKGWEDIPSNNLVRIMGESNFIAPATWIGYRELTEK